MAFYELVTARLIVSCTCTSETQPPDRAPDSVVEKAAIDDLGEQLITDPGSPADIFAEFRGTHLIQAGNLNVAIRDAMQILQTAINDRRVVPPGDTATILVDSPGSSVWQTITGSQHEVEGWLLREENSTVTPWTLDVDLGTGGEFIAYAGFLFELRALVELST
ncbi:MAG: hypothetical protein KF817_11015 [Phycisphaeraceae bacterium]|nr:hypothetical protein [Phycisphaeraceae bacterium]